MNISYKKSITFVLVLAMIAMCFIPVTTSYAAANDGVTLVNPSATTGVNPEAVSKAGLRVGFTDVNKDNVAGAKVEIMPSGGAVNTLIPDTGNDLRGWDGNTLVLNLQNDLDVEEDYTVTVSGFKLANLSDTIDAKVFKFKTEDKKYAGEFSPKSLNWAAPASKSDDENGKNKVVEFVNKGNVPTGAFEINLDGTDKKYFNITNVTATGLSSTATAKAIFTTENVGAKVQIAVAPTGVPLGMISKDYKADLSVKALGGTPAVNAGLNDAGKVDLTLSVQSDSRLLSSSPTALDMKVVSGHYTPADAAETFVLENAGNMQTEALKLTPTGDNNAFTINGNSTSITTITPKTTRGVIVAPAANLAVGTYQTSIEIGNATVGSITIPVKLTVEAANRTIGVPDHNFDAVVSYASVDTQAVVVENTGNLTATALTASLQNNTTNNFSIVSNSAVGTLGPGEKATIGIKVASGLDIGPYTAKLRVSNNDAAGSFSGEGTITFTVKAPNFKAKLNANGGTVSPTEVTIENGSTYNLPKATRKGYTFNGWYTAATGGTKVEGIANESADTEFFAQWTANKYQLIMSKNLKGSKISSTRKNVTFGQAIGTMPTPTAKYSKFKGWYTSKTGKTKVTSKTIVNFDKDTKIYAQWTKNAKMVHKGYFRTKASSKAGKIKLLKSGTQVTYLKVVKNKAGHKWAKIKYGSRTGYVLAKYVKKV